MGASIHEESSPLFPPLSFLKPESQLTQPCHNHMEKQLWEQNNLTYKLPCIGFLDNDIMTNMNKDKRSALINTMKKWRRLQINKTVGSDWLLDTHHENERWGVFPGEAGVPCGDSRVLKFFALPGTKFDKMKIAWQKKMEKTMKPYGVIPSIPSRVACGVFIQEWINIES